MMEMKHWDPAWICPKVMNKLQVHVWQTLTSLLHQWPSLSSHLKPHGGCGGESGKSPWPKDGRRDTLGPVYHEISQCISASEKWIATTLQLHSGTEGQSREEILPVSSLRCSTNGHWLSMREKKYWDLDIQGLWAGGNGFAALSGAWQKQNCLGTASLYWLSQLPFLTVLFPHFCFPRISGILI